MRYWGMLATSILAAVTSGVFLHAVDCSWSSGSSFINSTPSRCHTSVTVTTHDLSDCPCKVSGDITVAGNPPPAGCDGATAGGAVDWGPAGGHVGGSSGNGSIVLQWDISLSCGQTYKAATWCQCPGMPLIYTFLDQGECDGSCP